MSRERACPADLRDVLRAAGLTGEIRCSPMTGGVSSEIWLAAGEDRRVVAKRALPRLRVAAVWEAPVERSVSEAAWLRFAGAAVPGCCPRLLAHDEASGWLLLEYLDPATHRLWKADLLAGTVDPLLAGAVGDLLGRLHQMSATTAASTSTAGVADTFATDELFEALRLDPYLRVLLPLHPDVADRVEELVATTRRTHRALVHGDVSPKNVLAGPAGPVLLDAETAWWGDPAFDVAFLLTHLVAKAVHLPHLRAALVGAAGTFAGAYLGHVRWEPAAAVADRAAALLPAIALARVDGKSPLEYLDDDARQTLRARALDTLARRTPSLEVTVARLAGTG